MNFAAEALLGLDVGDKRVGVAMLSKGGMLATPVGTFLRAGGKAESEILTLISKHSIETVVVGLPLSDDGEKNEQCQKVEAFCRRLGKRIQVRIEFVDEYSSSYDAEEKIRSSGKRAKALKQKGIIDAAAATIILQTYLDRDTKIES